MTNRISVPITGNGSRPNSFNRPMISVSEDRDSVRYHFGNVSVVNELYGAGTDRCIRISGSKNNGIWINPAKAGTCGYDRFGVNVWGESDLSFYPFHLGMDAEWNEYWDNFLEAGRFVGRVPFEEARRFMANLLIMYSAIGSFDIVAYTCPECGGHRRPGQTLCYNCTDINR